MTGRHIPGYAVIAAPLFVSALRPRVGPLPGRLGNLRCSAGISSDARRDPGSRREPDWLGLVLGGRRFRSRGLVAGQLSRGPALGDLESGSCVPHGYRDLRSSDLVVVLRRVATRMVARLFGSGRVPAVQRHPRQCRYADGYRDGRFDLEGFLAGGAPADGKAKPAALTIPFPESMPKATELEQAIADALYPIKAYDLSDVCTSFGLKPPDGDDPFTSKNGYVLRRLKPLSEDQLIEVARKVQARYPFYALEEILALRERPMSSIITFLASAEAL